MLTVVTGPPCSGKSTHVLLHARPGDIIIDLDLIAQALGSDRSHGHADQITRVAMTAREAAIRAVLTLHRGGARAWIVDCDPSSARREQYHRAGARWVRLTASRAELHRRAADRPAEWHQMIDRQLAGPTPRQG